MFGRVIAFCIIAVSAGGNVERQTEANPTSYTSGSTGIYDDDKHAGQVLMSSASSDDSSINNYANYYMYPTQELLEEYSKYLHMKYNDEDDPRKKRNADSENQNSLDRNRDIKYYDYYNNKDLIDLYVQTPDTNIEDENGVHNIIKRADTEDLILMNEYPTETITKNLRNSQTEVTTNTESSQAKENQENKHHKYKHKYHRHHKGHHNQQHNVKKSTKKPAEKKENIQAKQARNKYLKEQSKHGNYTYHSRKHHHHTHKEHDQNSDIKQQNVNETQSHETAHKINALEHHRENRESDKEGEEKSGVSGENVYTKRVYKPSRGSKHFTTSDLSSGLKRVSENNNKTKSKVQRKKKRPEKYEDHYQIFTFHYHDHNDHEHENESDKHKSKEHKNEDDDDDDDSDEDELDEEDVRFINKYYKDVLKNNTRKETTKKENSDNVIQTKVPEDSAKTEIRGHSYRIEHGHYENNNKHHANSNDHQLHHEIQSEQTDSKETKKEEEGKEKATLEDIKDVLFQHGFNEIKQQAGLVPTSEVIINQHADVNNDYPEFYRYKLYHQQPETTNEDFRYANSYSSYHDQTAPLYQPQENFGYLTGYGLDDCEDEESLSPSTSYVEKGQPYAQTYNFEYGVDDPQTGDMKSHYETRDGDVVIGEYKFTESDGKVRIVKYKVDKENGFKALVLREGANGVVEVKK